jgi:putative SbcD/Mre11-related phosphoesterase
MHITPECQAIDLALFFPKDSVLVMCDFHIGYEDALKASGVLVPETQLKQMEDRLEYIFSKVKPKTIVINGDIKHEFGRISKQEWRDTIKMIDYLAKKCDKLLLIEGNHDNIMFPIAEKKNIQLIDEYRFSNVLITHGDKIPEKLEDIVVIGHEHPAISLRDEAKSEKFKCYLKGKFQKSTLIVQPSFHQLNEGTNILQQKVLSPLINDPLEMEVFIVDDKTHEVLFFGVAKDLE